MILATENRRASIVVAVRVRPFTSKELEQGENVPVIRMPKPGIVHLLTNRLPRPRIRQFVFDHTFWSFDKRSASALLSEGPSFADQAVIYKTIANPLLQRALDGYNVCLFAYGMTSSGKTYSITGTSDDPGVIPRLAHDLFEQISTRQSSDVSYSIEMSYFEIYNERIRDLLSNDKTDQLSLAVREHPVTGPYVEGLNHTGVRSATDITGWLHAADRQRIIASTEFNDQSSRSHAVLTLYITRRTVAKYHFGDLIESVYTSRINIVDLAGSERQYSLKSIDRHVECCQINKSLFTLGKVISELSRNLDAHSVMNMPLSEPRTGRHPVNVVELQTPSQISSKRAGFVSYRDSVLTWLLKDSLGGNSMTTMLATVSPSALQYNETLATLRYAKKAQSIINTAVINEDPQGRMIRQLLAEVARLRQASSINPEPGSPQAFEVARLRELLSLREKEVRELSRQVAERTLHYDSSYNMAVSPMNSTDTHHHYDGIRRSRLVLPDRATSPLLDPFLAASFTVDNECTPLKRPSTVCIGTNTSIIDLPSRLRRDVFTTPKDDWGCTKSEHDRLLRDLARLESQLIVAMANSDSTKQSLVHAQLICQKYKSYNSILLQLLCDRLGNLTHLVQRLQTLSLSETPTNQQNANFNGSQISDPTSMFARSNGVLRECNLSQKSL